MQNDSPKKTTFFQVYKPIFLILAILTTTTLVIELSKNAFNHMNFLTNFMAGFFLIFSFFKLLDITKFAKSYGTYDLLAKKIPFYGKAYPFIELFFGLSLLTGLLSLYINLAIFFIMLLSTLGVLNGLIKKQKLQCACLGTLFDLPMSKVTLIEDLLMTFMSLYMVIYYLR